MHPCIHTSIHSSHNPYVYPSIHPFIHPSTHPSISKYLTYISFRSFFSIVSRHPSVPSLSLGARSPWLSLLALVTHTTSTDRPRFARRTLITCINKLVTLQRYYTYQRVGIVTTLILIVLLYEQFPD